MKVARRLIGISIVAMFMVTACHPTATDRYSVTAGALTISSAYLVTPIGDAPAAMYFTVQNAGPTVDTLIGVRVTGVQNAELHMDITSSMPHTTTQPMSHAMPSMTMTTMTPTREVVVPAGAALHLVPGGRHVMLMGMQRRFTRGDSTEADITFRHTGAVHVPVRVIDYTQLDTLVRKHATE